MRILAEQERRFLSEDAQELAYIYIQESQIPSEVLEKALLEAMIIGRQHKGRVSPEILEYLIMNQYEMHCSSIGAGTERCSQLITGC